MNASQIYLKLLRWGIFISLFLPLVIFSQYLSPFHFGKMIIFRSLVEIMAVIYILLIIGTGKKYLPKWSPIVIAVTVFTGLYALTSFIGVDFNYSFWGTLERMGGLFSFLHFWVFFIILVSIIRDKKDWERILRISIFVGFLSILFAYGQYFKLGDFFIGWQHGSRVIGTIGNPALFAGYLLFVLFLAIYLLLKNAKNANKNANYANLFYGLVLVLGIPVLHMTAVRGSVLAFWGGLFLLGLVYLFALKNKRTKAFILIGLIIFLILVGFIWINKDRPWVKNTDWLRRIADISLEDRTVQTRLWSWQSGWEGFKERPVLGWGPENFVLAHAKYFKPGHFTGMGSETIWDRAHNTVLEMLTTMGIVGLLSYLSIFVAVFYLLIRGFKRKKINFNTAAIFGVMLIAYFFHNLFIFDTMANYFMFFITIGYIANLHREHRSITENTEKKTHPVLAIILIFLAIVLIYKTNIEPARANYACTRAILAGRAGNIQKAFDKYQQALSYKSYQGKYEIRHRLAAFAIQNYRLLQQKDPGLNQVIVDYSIEELKKNTEAHSLDYVSYLYLGRIYTLLINEKPEWAGAQAEAAIQSAKAINDKNPQVWYELGQAKLSQEKYDEAIEVFEQALKLNPEVGQSYWFLGIVHFRAGNVGEAIKYIDQAAEKGYNYKSSTVDIIRLIDLYTEVGDYHKIIDLYKAAIELQPKNAQFYASLAAVYKEVGDVENAILYAQEAIKIDPGFREEAEAFINSLK